MASRFLLRGVASAAARSARGHRLPVLSGAVAGPGTSRSIAPAAQVFRHYASSSPSGTAELNGNKGARDNEANSATWSKILSTTPKWAPPPSGWIKINVAATFTPETRQATAGVVIRDEHGAVLLSASKLLRRCSSSEKAAWMACDAGLQMSRQWKQSPAILESDYGDNIGIGAVNRERMKDEGFRELRPLKVRRDQNSIAHELAQHARREKTSTVWRNKAPSFVEHQVLAERRVAKIGSMINFFKSLFSKG
ncbi:hypothetical protein ACP70R_015239 [Stipagrostis hirtigluma subsp. patula]